MCEAGRSGECAGLSQREGVWSARQPFVNLPPTPNNPQVRGGVEGGISYLLRKRGQDPYADLLRRLAYEASWAGRQAPSFEP